MATNDWFDDADWNRLVANTLARAEAVNAFMDGVVVFGGLLPSRARMMEGRINIGTDAGLVNAYIVTLPYSFTLSDGAELEFRPVATNTAGATVNVIDPDTPGGHGPIQMRNYAGAALTGGEAVQDAFVRLRYDLTNNCFRIVNPLTAVGSVTTFDINALTAETVPADADTLPIYDASALAQRKMTLPNLLVNGWTVAADVDPLADYTLIYDASAGALKKVLTGGIADEGALMLKAKFFCR